MKVDELKEVLDQHNIFYRYDGMMKLWQIIVDDLSVYISPQNLEVLNKDMFPLYLNKELVLEAERQENPDEVILH